MKESFKPHISLQETLDFPAELPAKFGENFTGNLFPADFA